MENAAHLLDIHDIWIFPQHQPVCFPLREHIWCLHLEPPLSDQPPCLCFFSTAAVSIGCAIYFSFPGWGDLQAAVDRVIAPARRCTVRARAPPESIGGREEVSLSANTILAAGIPNPATVCVNRSDGCAIVVAAQGCVAPVLHSYLQTDYAIFKVQKDASNNRDKKAAFVPPILKKFF